MTRRWFLHWVFSFVYISFSSFLVLGDPTQITLMDVGQGGPGTIITHGKKGVLIDIGSRELEGATAYNLSLLNKTDTIESPPSVEFTLLPLAQPPVSNMATENEATVSTPAGSNDSPESFRREPTTAEYEAYRKSVLKIAHQALQGIEELTILVTHPDADHYNWFLRLFPAGDKRIKTIILSGFLNNIKMIFAPG